MPNILDLIADLNFWYKEQEIGVIRDELAPVLKLVDMKDISFFILGVRRAGKTFLAKQILKRKIEQGISKEQTLYVNFEDNKLEPYLNESLLDQLYESYRNTLNTEKFVYIVLDEVQNVKGWEKWVRTILEKREKVKIIITGSGSRILTPKLATILTGRKIKYNLFPLSFEQFMGFKGKEAGYLKEKEYLKLLQEYCEFGGFPLVVLNDSKEQKKYFLQELYDDIVTKDISFRFRLREEKLLRKISFLVMNNFSKYASIRKIKDTLKSLLHETISTSTLSNYFEYFSRSFLFVFVPIYSRNIKDQDQYPKKVYCVDTGLIASIIPKFSENLGRYYENVVFIELLRRKSLDRKNEFYYWKNSQGYEVDFIVKQGLQVKELIQVCYDISDEKTKERELHSLLQAMEEFKLKKGLILTKDFEKEERVKGKKILFVPLWKWLLRK